MLIFLFIRFHHFQQAILELAALETGIEYKSECMKYIFGMPGENGVIGCQHSTHLLCFRAQLDRIAGPFGQRRTKRLKFLNPRNVDINYRPYGNIPDHRLAETRGVEEEIDLAENILQEVRKDSPLVWHWVNYEPRKREYIVRHMLGKERWQGDVPLNEIESHSWCREVVNTTLGCGVGSSGEVCKHLPHNYITQC